MIFSSLFPTIRREFQSTSFLSKFPDILTERAENVSFFKCDNCDTNKVANHLILNRTVRFFRNLVSDWQVKSNVQFLNIQLIKNLLNHEIAKILLLLNVTFFYICSKILCVLINIKHFLFEYVAKHIKCFSKMNVKCHMWFNFVFNNKMYFILNNNCLLFYSTVFKLFGKQYCKSFLTNSFIFNLVL